MFLRLEMYMLSAWFGCVSKIRDVCCPQGLDVFLRLEMYMLSAGFGCVSKIRDVHAVRMVWMCF